jgi:hypothetical protein
MFLGVEGGARFHGILQLLEKGIWTKLVRIGMERKTLQNPFWNSSRYNFLNLAINPHL